MQGFLAILLVIVIKVLDKHKEMEEKRNEERDKYTIM